MAPPINVQDWYGDRHTCQIASGALGYYYAGQSTLDLTKTGIIACEDSITWANRRREVRGAEGAW